MKNRRTRATTPSTSASKSRTPPHAPLFLFRMANTDKAQLATVILSLAQDLSQRTLRWMVDAAGSRGGYTTGGRSTSLCQLTEERFSVLLS